MTVEAAPAGTYFDRQDDGPGHDLEEISHPADIPPRRHLVVFRGGGQNVEHMATAVANVNVLHPVHVVEMRQPMIPVEPDRLHLINTDEGIRSIEQLLGSGVVHVVYNSLTPELHKPTIVEDLKRVGDDQLDLVVVAKPAVQNLKEMRAVDLAIQAAKEQLAILKGLAPGSLKKDMLFVHEHYLKKGPWPALLEKLAELTERLGRLSNVDINIEEARTVESENRTKAFAGGALEDLGPHLISLGLSIQSSMNSTGRYTIPNRSQTSIERFRYEESELDEKVETGFAIRGETQIIEIIDGKDGQAHDLAFVWRGGKGGIDCKKAILEFVHPDTGAVSAITVDFSAKTLDVPEVARDLFPIIKFEEDGYRDVIEEGLNGGDPNRSFQSWDEARTVIKWIHQLTRHKPDVKTHKEGTSLEELMSIS